MKGERGIVLSFESGLWANAYIQIRTNTVIHTYNNATTWDIHVDFLSEFSSFLFFPSLSYTIFVHVYKRFSLVMSMRREKKTVSLNRDGKPTNRREFTLISPSLFFISVHVRVWVVLVSDRWKQLAQIWFVL